MKALIWIGMTLAQTLWLKGNTLDPLQHFADRIHLTCLGLITSHASPWNWFYAAILIGEDEGLRHQTTLQPFFVLGLYHLIVVSGSHVLAFEKILEVIFFWAPRKIKRAAVAVGLGLFTFANQLQPSCSRAFIHWLIKENLPLNRIVNADLHMLVTCVSLIIQPKWIHSLSFQLSCAATLGLAVAGEFRLRNSWLSRLGSALSCTLLTCPLVFFFQPCLSWIVIPANTLALPVFETVLLPLSLFNVAFPFSRVLTEKILIFVFEISRFFAGFENPVFCYDVRRSKFWGFIYLTAVYFCWRALLPFLARQRFWIRQLNPHWHTARN